MPATESRAVQIARQLQKEIEERSRESNVFTSGTYHDVPIIRLGRDLRRDATPERITQMHAIARELDYLGSYDRARRTFFEQAAFMADFADDYPYAGPQSTYAFVHGYEGMSDRQLRGYFTWRARWRSGEAGEAAVSFVLLHACELLCRVGSESTQAGYDELARLRDAYPDAHLLKRWVPDYALYYGLDPSLVVYPDPVSRLSAAVSVLVTAEQGLLASDDPATWRQPEGGPTADELLSALCVCSRYRLERSALMREHRAELAEVCADVFARMVDHCRRRRQTGFVEGMFGPAVRVRHILFGSALFCPSGAHPDVIVRINPCESFRCSHNMWFHDRGFSRVDTNAKLGDLLQTIDRLLRERIGGLNPLKERTVPKFELAFVNEAVDALFEREAKAQAVHVEIDRTKLSGIRRAAAHTRESLLVEEERLEAVDPVEPPLPAEATAARELVPAAAPAAEPVREPEPAAPVTPAPDAPAEEGPLAQLTDVQRRMLAELAAGTFDSSAWEKDGVLPEIEVDAINEALFDQVGDAVIEYGDAGPQVSEFYMDDVREMLQ